MPSNRTISRNCETCESPFQARTRVIPRGHGRFCSIPCSRVARRGHHLVTSDEFWLKVAIGKPHECWEWQGGRFSTGYGAVNSKGNNVGTHRLAWTFTNGPIPDGLVVMHSCDNPPCCNPAHLKIGTNQANTRDSTLKGRRPSGDRNPSRLHPERLARGERHGNARLTPANILEIRRRYQPRIISTRALGAEYGVSATTISQIIRRLAWGHVEPTKQ